MASIPLPQTPQVQLVRIFKAVFDAAPGHTYLQLLENELNRLGSVAAVANELLPFATSTPNDPQAVADLVVKNLHLTGDVATTAKAYLVAQFQANPNNFGGVIVTGMDLLATLVNDPVFGPAAQAVNDSVATALAFSLDPNNTTTDLGTLQQADEPTQAPPGTQAFNLTENVETIIGTEEDDTFNAPTKVVPGLGQLNTLQTGDSLDGKGGTDTLVAQLVANATPTLQNIENLKLTSFGATTLNLTNSSGIQNIEFTGNTGAATVTGLGQVVPLSASGIVGNQNITLNYLDSALAGTSDQQQINLSNAQLGTLSFNNTTTGGLESLAINSSSSTVFNIAGSAVVNNTTEVTVEGDGLTVGNFTTYPSLATLAFTGLDGLTKLTSFDASKATGPVKAVISTGTTNNVVSVKGGAGDDTIVLGTTLTSQDSVDLGDGAADTLVIQGNANASSYQVSNVERLEVFTNGANTVNAKAFSGVNDIDVVTTNNAHSMTVNGLADKGMVTVTDQVNAAPNILVALTVNGANTVGTNDTVNLKLNAHDPVPGGSAPFTPSLTVTTVTANQFENVNIESIGVAGATNQITTFTDAAQKTVTITGDRDLVVGNAFTAPTVDASAFSANLNIVAAGSGASGGKQTVKAGTGDDTIGINSANLNQNQSLDGGDGVDTLLFTNNGAINFAGVTNSAKLAGVKNFEKVGLNDTANTTLTIDDATLGHFTNNAIDVAATGNAGNTVTLNASAVLVSTSKVNFDASKLTAGNASFTISNAQDTFTGSSQNDTVTVTNGPLLQPTDVLNGGNGTDTLKFDTTGNQAQTITASQLAGVSSFETIQIADTAATANTISLTLDNTAVANNVNAAGNLTITAAGNANDTVTVDAGAAAGSFSITLTGGNKGDTLKGGAGNDTITGGLGNDTITLGDGKDDVVYTAVNEGLDTIKDFDFGAASGTNANVDQFNLSAFITQAASNGAAFDTVGKASAANLAGADVLVLDDQGYANLAAAQTAWETGVGAGNNGNIVVLWQDTLGRVHLSVDTDGNTAGNGFDLAILEGVTIAGVASTVDVGDFIVG